MKKTKDQTSYVRLSDSSTKSNSLSGCCLPIFFALKSNNTKKEGLLDKEMETFDDKKKAPAKKMPAKR